MMFPDVNLTAAEDEIITSPALEDKTFDFDFTAGEFVLQDGKPVEVDNLEGLKVWMTKVLKTEKDRFGIYAGTEYGVSLEDLIGSTLPQGFRKSEFKREIEEALVKHEAVSGISDFLMEQDGAQLTVSFQVNLTDGATINQEVTV